MLALDLREGIARGLQETVVGIEHLAVEVELDDRRGTPQGLEQALMLAGGLDGARQVIAEQPKARDLTLAVMEGMQDAAQPGFTSVAAQQVQGAAVGLTATQALLQPTAVLLVFDVRRDEIHQGATQELRRTQAHFLFEVGVH